MNVEWTTKNKSPHSSFRIDFVEYFVFLHSTFQIDVHGQMVAEAAEVSWADVGAKEFLPVVGLIVLKQEVCVKNSCATFFIMKPFPIIHHSRCDDDLVKNLPVGLMFQGAFKAQAIVFAKQIDETAFLHFGGMACSQHVVNTRIGRTIVQVAIMMTLGW